MKAKTESQLKLPKYYASVIVMNHLGEVLLGIRKEDGIATPPGGHAQDHETPPQAALRELFEETSIAAVEHQLQTLSTIDTTNGKVCHCYLLITSPAKITSKLDPDSECPYWMWYPEHNLPEQLSKDPRRFESVRNALMRFHGITKGGEGSGKVGHTTQKQRLDLKGQGMKLVDLSNKMVEANPVKEHLHKLENGAIFEGHNLRSGKPLYLKTDQAMAHSYTPEDYREAGSFHYEKFQNINSEIEKIKALGKKPQPDLEKIAKFHMRQFKTNFGMAERTHKRTAATEVALADRKKEASAKARESKIKKSVVMMGYNDGAEVDTAKFAVEHQIARDGKWLHIMNEAMLGFQYGDAPRSITIDKGELHLVKVDDGMYSGYVKLVSYPEGTQGSMEDTAKVRIERMTIPSMIQFLMAKEYIMDHPPQPPLLLPEPVMALTEKLSMPEPIKVPVFERIRILELLEKLVL